MLGQAGYLLLVLRMRLIVTLSIYAEVLASANAGSVVVIFLSSQARIVSLPPLEYKKRDGELHLLSRPLL